MPQQFLELDCEGYVWNSEPGFPLRLSGPTLAKKFAFDPARGSFFGRQFALYGEWFMPRPLQTNPEWYSDSRMEDYLLNLDLWTFTAGVGLAEHPWYSKRSDGTGYAWDKGFAVVVGDSPTSLDSTDYGEMVEAAHLGSGSLGLVTIATATLSPTSIDITGNNVFSPSLQVLLYPQPDDLLVFGWHRMAFLLYRDLLHVLKDTSETGDRSAWDLKRTVPLNRTHYNWWDIRRDWPLSTPADARAKVRQIIAVPAGADTLWLHLGGEPIPIRLRDTRDEALDAESESMFGEGNWWIGAAGGQKFNIQPQIVGYESVTTDAAVPGTKPVVFDLGATYAPTQDPVLNAGVVMHPETGSITRTDDPDGTVLLEADGGEEIEYQLRKPDNTGWESDGTNTQGGIYIRLKPADHKYSAPGIQFISLRFPPLQAPRTVSTLLLDSNQFKGWELESSLLEPTGKRGILEVWDLAGTLLSALGFDKRRWYPFRIFDREGTGEEAVDTVRVRGWVLSPGRLEQFAAADDEGKSFFSLQARGILIRADTQFKHLPHLVDPSSSDGVDSIFAIKEALRLKGLDADDAAQLLVYEPATPEEIDVTRLPRTTTNGEPIPGLEAEGHWFPDWDETAIQYAQRVAEDWKGWRIYELLSGVVYLTPIAEIDLQYPAAFAYLVSARLYRTHASAAAAGAPNQVYEPLASYEGNPPTANVIQVFGRDLDGKPLLVVDQDLPSIEDPEAWNYAGEPIVANFPLKMAVDLKAAKQLARKIRRRKAVPEDTWTVRVPTLAPWQMVLRPGIESAPDVGRVLELEDKGAGLIVHTRVKLLRDAYTHPAEGPKPALYQTEFTLLRLPGVAVEGAAADFAYPGVSLIPEEEEEEE